MVLRIQFTKMRVIDIVVFLLCVLPVVTYAGKIPQRPSRSASANDGDVIRFDLGKLQPHTRYFKIFVSIIALGRAFLSLSSSA